MSQVKTGNQVFTSPGDIAEAFKNHFTNKGQSLVKEIPSSEIFKIVLSELSPNPAMTLVPDFFLTRMVGTIYPLGGLNKKLI